MSKDINRDAVKREVALRVLQVTTGAGLTIGECADIHIQLLVGLALEISGGNQRKAADILEPDFKLMIRELRAGKLQVTQPVQNGNVLNG